MKKFLFTYLFVFICSNCICIAQKEFKLELLKLNSEKLGLKKSKVYKCELSERRYGDWENSDAMLVRINPFMLQEGYSVYMANFKDSVEFIDNFVPLKATDRGIGLIDFNNSISKYYPFSFITRDGGYMFFGVNNDIGLYDLTDDEVIEKRNKDLIYSFNRIGRIATTPFIKSDEYQRNTLNVYFANMLKREDSGSGYLEISQIIPTYRNLAIIAIEKMMDDYENKHLLKQYTSISSNDNIEQNYKFICRGVKTIKEKVRKSVPIKHIDWVDTKCMVIFDCMKVSPFFGENKIGTFCSIFDLKTFELEQLIELEKNQLLIPSKYEGFFVLSMYNGHIWKYSANGILQWENQFAEKDKEGAYSISEILNFDPSSEYGTNVYIAGTSTIAPYVGYNNPVIWEINGQTHNSRKIELYEKGAICVNIIAYEHTDLYIQMLKKEKGIWIEYQGNGFTNTFYNHINQLLIK